MVQWVVDAVRSCEIEDICIVTGHGAEYIEDYFGDTVQYARQTEQLGTGHAVMAASDFIKKHSGSDVLILFGDAPFISKDTIEGMYNAHKEAGCTCTLLSAVLDNPFGYGRIFKNNGKFEKIVEERDCTAEQKLIKEANVGMYWCLHKTATTWILTPSAIMMKQLRQTTEYSFISSIRARQSAR